MPRSHEEMPPWATPSLPIELAATTNPAFEASEDDVEVESEAETCTVVESSASSDSGIAVHSTRLPSLYPCFIPSKSQHFILATTQDILEACCFEFAQKWLPHLVVGNQWDSHAAVDLKRWTQILGDVKFKRTVQAANIDLEMFQFLLLQVQNLRDVSVHRTRTAARSLSQLLRHAQAFSMLLDDRERAATIGRLQDALDSTIYTLEQAKKSLESRTYGLLRSLEEEHALLRRRGEEAVSSMLLVDIENQTQAGQALEASIAEVIQRPRKNNEDNCAAARLHSVGTH